MWMDWKLVAALALIAGGFGLWVNYPDRAQIGGEAVDLFQSYGNWETLCDQLPENPNSRRCYLRLVDVYSHRPNFGAYVGFITYDKGVGQKFDLSLEPGAILVEKGFRLKDNSVDSWLLDQKMCSGNECSISGIYLERMINAAKTADQFEISFVDKTGQVWDRTLSSSDFIKAHSAFQKALKEMN